MKVAPLIWMFPPVTRLELKDSQVGWVAGIAFGVRQLTEQTADRVAVLPQLWGCVKGIK